MREGIRVREITNGEGRRLLQIVRAFSGSVVRWRPRVQMVLLSAEGMDVALTSPRWPSGPGQSSPAQKIVPSPGRPRPALFQLETGAVPGVALLHPRLHRPPLTRGAELDDPPRHCLARP